MHTGSPSVPERFEPAFLEAFGRSPAFLVRAPGRVDLIGAHVDYNEGPVLVAAIDREVWLTVAPRAGDVTTVVARDLGERVSFRARDLEERRDRSGAPLPTWALYPAGVMWALSEADLEAPALDVLVSSTLPMGAGLSSSAAVEVAFAIAWRQAAGWALAPMALAQLCRHAENAYVGVACGLMDPFASVFGRTDHALLLDCRTLDWEAVSIPEGVSLVVADTGTRRRLSDGRLNERQSECAEAVRLLAAHRPAVRALRDVSPAELDRLSAGWPPVVRARAEHVVAEMDRVRRTVGFLVEGSITQAGAMLLASHESARDLYDVSGPELEAMWVGATAHPDCIGGKAVGAGFAGCMVFLVRSPGVDSFVGETRQRFSAATGRVARLDVVRAAPGASVAEIG